MKSVWQKIAEFFKTQKWAKWVAIGIVVILSAFLATVFLVGESKGDLESINSANRSEEIEKVASKGLEMEVSYKERYCTVVGIGTCTDIDIVIPSTYNNLPVRSIWDKAFKACIGIVSVEIGDGVKYFSHFSFMNCTSLTSVNVTNR